MVSVKLGNNGGELSQLDLLGIRVLGWLYLNYKKYYLLVFAQCVLSQSI